LDNLQSKRDQILAAYFAAVNQRNQLSDAFSQAGSDQHHLSEAIDLASQRVFEQSEAYLAALPERVISRCPYTGELLRSTVDDLGLGGPWWNHAEPVRKDIIAPATFFALDGAMNIRYPMEKAPFTVFPGPDKPFVIPALLQRREIKAVISALPVAGNPTWWIAYFAYPMPQDLPGINDYGTNRYSFINTYGHRQTYASIYSESDYDFDLEKWIRLGKVLWIAPDDELYRLRAQAAGCPYLGLPGTGKIQIIRNGTVTFFSDLKIDVRAVDEAQKRELAAAIQQVKSRGDQDE